MTTRVRPKPESAQPVRQTGLDLLLCAPRLCGGRLFVSRWRVFCETKPIPGYAERDEAWGTEDAGRLRQTNPISRQGRVGRGMGDAERGGCTNKGSKFDFT
jgi:hypothetical protein